MKSPLFIFFFLVLAGCQNNSGDKAQESDYKSIGGEAQGTTYTVTFQSSEDIELKKNQLDSIFTSIDQSLSLWVNNSVIRRFNDEDSIFIDDPHFLNVYFRAQEIKEMTSGAFEPMILPLVKYWGFGPDGAYKKMEGELEPLLNLMKQEVFTTVDSSQTADRLNVKFIKQPGQQIDVNGIAQGYAVDVVCEYLGNLGIRNYMVELGGEVRSNGKNPTGEWWRVGVDKPVPLEAERKIEIVIPLQNQALVTSGSYRKFYEVDGQKYSHTIDPFTGKPVDHNLLSVSVLASNATNADALATAFMVMGLENTKEFLSLNPELDLEVFMIYQGPSGENETYMTEGIKEIADRD
jgi:thiamine biosynthesis lipoprotein